MEGYDIAQVCFNGHVICSTAGSSPQFRKSRCNICGEKTLMNCPNCNSKIKGYYHVEGFLDVNMHYELPRFCEDCGEAYPWIGVKVNTAIELVDLIENLTPNEKSDLQDSIKELVKESAKVPIAKVKLKKYLLKVNSDISDGIKDVLKDTLRTELRKELFG
jgi:hypothetical protein